jgi:hypothetical protein
VIITRRLSLTRLEARAMILKGAMGKRAQRFNYFGCADVRCTMTTIGTS